MNIDSINHPSTKAERREQKKRPRMPIHGASLKKPNSRAGFKLAKVKKSHAK
jgi:hypothetical protein